MTGLTQEARTLLRELGLAPRKAWGQHFMTNPKTLSFLADALSLKTGQAVLEIGPGLGFLTRHLLLTGAQVVAVEKDRRLSEFLSRSLPLERFGVIPQDILKVDLESLDLEKPIKVVGNIPYRITSPILKWLLDQRRLVTEAVLTVQEEVAQRLGALPNTKAWGALSIFVQFYARVEILRRVPKTHFFPPPQVDSAIVKLSFLQSPKVPVADETHFFSLVRRSFQKRRKTLLNALSGRDGLSREGLLETLNRLGIDSQRRPETLTLSEWGRLSDALNRAGVRPLFVLH